ncbi:MAG: hypothetical protein Q8S13_03970 [Dehalococcoidia bacterium]|nr:hypothetical protein [Dehalococcoidia bacterium]
MTLTPEQHGLLVHIVGYTKGKPKATVYVADAKTGKALEAAGLIDLKSRKGGGFSARPTPAGARAVG